MLRTVALPALAFCALAAIAPAALAQSHSPYAGQEARDIKALSAQEVSDLLAGRGMGFAKAAELNGYPGPAHVLELAGELGLTPAQKAKTEDLFARMQASAIPLGKQLVAEERALDTIFASKSVTRAMLADALSRIARLQARVREAHLSAHLEQVALLTPDQVARYNRLRGYGAGAGHDAHPMKH